MKITLCGSTRFREAFIDWNIILTLAGHTVYGLGGFGREVKDVGKPESNILVTDEQKRRLDLVHLSKISNSEAVVVLNVDGYIGESTIREIEWARLNGKDVYWLNNSVPGRFLGPTVWHLKDLFNDAPLAEVPGAAKYANKDRPASGGVLEKTP